MPDCVLHSGRHDRGGRCSSNCRRSDNAPDPAAALAQHGDLALPSGAEALDEPFTAFPSWFLRITCERCGKDRMIKQVHAPQSDLTSIACGMTDAAAGLPRRS
jgi:hypothetical protein